MAGSRKVRRSGSSPLARRACRPWPEGLEGRALLDAAAASDFGRVPLGFEPNVGQATPEVAYLTRGPGYDLALGPEGAALSLEPAGAAPAVLRLQLVGANPSARFEAQDALPGKTNYLVGDDPGAWLTDVPNFGRVVAHDVYPGIDQVYYGDHRQLEYDFRVAPGVDPTAIRLSFAGALGMTLDARGDLVLHAAGGDVVEHAPDVYQEAGDGSRQEVAGRFVLEGDGQVGFALGPYDASRPLVIDPVLDYATYFGAGGEDYGFGIAVDDQGDAYITGETTSTDFPVVHPFQPPDPHGGGFAFVTKFNAYGNVLLYSTILGGHNGNEGFGIAVDAAHNAYVTGITGSTDFPIKYAFQPANGGNQAKGVFGDAFVTELDPTGSNIVYSSYLGGSDSETGKAIAVTRSGEAVVVGSTLSADLPTRNPAEKFPNDGGYNNGFVVKVASGGGSLVYATYLGGNRDDFANGVDVDKAGAAYVTGTTSSGNFPTKGPVPGNGPSNFNAFATKYSPTGAYVYSTYLGGKTDATGNAIAVDDGGNAYITGEADDPDFPTKAAFQKKFGGGTSDAYVIKLNANGNALAFATFLGGSDGELGTGIAVTPAGEAYVVGDTRSAAAEGSTKAFPQLDAVQGYGGDGDAFLTRFKADGLTLIDSTYIGGSGTDHATGVAVGPSGNAFVVGHTQSTDFPTVNPYQASYREGSDAFVVQIGSPLPPPPIARAADFDGDGRSDLAVFDQSVGVYYVSTPSGPQARQFGNGAAALVPVAGDFDFDGQTDLAAYSLAYGVYYIAYSGGSGGPGAIPMGNPNDVNIPVTGDYNGDGKSDPALFDASQGIYYVAPIGLPPVAHQFGNGAARLVPVVGDFDGDHRTDLAAYSLAYGVLYIQYSGGGAGLLAAIAMGNPSDVNIPIAGDFDGDGKSDPALFDQSLGIYFVAPIGKPPIAHQFGNGAARLVPTAGDYDGDGRADLAAYSLAFGVYYVAPSGAAPFAQQFGNNTDTMIPQPGSYVPPAVQALALAETKADPSDLPRPAAAPVAEAAVAIVPRAVNQRSTLARQVLRAGQRPTLAAWFVRQRPNATAIAEGLRDRHQHP